MNQPEKNLMTDAFQKQSTVNETLHLMSGSLAGRRILMSGEHGMAGINEYG